MYHFTDIVKVSRVWTCVRMYSHFVRACPGVMTDAVSVTFCCVVNQWWLHYQINFIFDICLFVCILFPQISVHVYSSTSSSSTRSINTSLSFNLHPVCKIYHHDVTLITFSCACYLVQSPSSSRKRFCTNELTPYSILMLIQLSHYHIH